jgi:5-methylcytosine-specific restriction endonuclease McrA
LAKNTGNRKRDAVKWIRDKAKSAYQKKGTCFVCGGVEDLELHHTHSMVLMMREWCGERGYPLNTDEDVLKIRDEFIKAHHREIYEEVYTLCNPHHVQLHQVFGKAPALTTGPRQKIWLEEQRSHRTGEQVVVPQAEADRPSFRVSNWFSEFYGGERLLFSSLAKA